MVVPEAVADGIHGEPLDEELKEVARSLSQPGRDPRDPASPSRATCRPGDLCPREWRASSRRCIEARQKGSSLAEKIVKRDVCRSEPLALTAHAPQQALELVDGFCGGPARFTEEVLQVAASFEAHQASPIDVDRDGPYIPFPDRAEIAWGGGVRDLDAVVDVHSSDFAIFDAPQLSEYLGWTSHLLQSSLVQMRRLDQRSRAARGWRR